MLLAFTAVARPPSGLIPGFSVIFEKVARILILFVVSVWAVAAHAAPHKFRVHDPKEAEHLLAVGGKLIADYGSFQLIEADVDPGTLAIDTQAELDDDANLIELNAQTLDTRTPPVKAMRKSAAGFHGKRLHLVQFAGPIKPEWWAALEQNGVQVVNYIPENAYLVYGNSAAIAKLESWAATASEVQWDGDYADDYKVNPRARLMDANGNPQNSGTNFAVQLIEDTNANPATLALIDQLELAPVKREFHTLHFLNVIVSLPPDQITTLSAQPDVISIQPYQEPKKLDERQDQILAGNLTGTAPAGPGYLSWLASVGFSQQQFDASGFLVDVSDSGIDNGTTAPGHFGFYDSGNPFLSSRVVYNRLEGKPNPGSTLQGCDGHGNLNAHIIAGFSDLPPGFPHTDSSGYEYELGVCPFVRLGSSVIFDPDNFTSPNYANLESAAYHDGAHIGANSWGADVNGVYDVDAQAYDALVRDAQPGGSTYAAPGNQEMVLVFAAGNAGSRSKTMDSPGSAKNVITVGAAESVRSLSFANGGNSSSGNDGCSTTDSSADNANDIADFSSRGPCSDGRMKPELVAPGTHITGGAPQSGAATTSGTGAASTCFSGSGICGLSGDNFFPQGQQFYTESSGTSHATPAVAGACALLRQYFINYGLTPPSPAMTKAFLVNSARYLNGSGANDTLWSPNQGMGELDLGMAFDGTARLLRDQIAEDKFTGTGQTRTFTATIADSTKPLRVTLAWTDAPGSTTGKALNNDLDLSVTAGGQTYKGNVFSGANSITGGTFDRKNNMESVFLQPGISGVITVTVTAANINSDGVPNEAPIVDQDFALVVNNATQNPLPVILPGTATLIGETCAPTNGAVDPGETVVMNFTFQNLGSANTSNLVASLLEINGVIFPGDAQSLGVLVAGGAAAGQAFSFAAKGTCGDTIHPTFRLTDGTNYLGLATFAVPLGHLGSFIAENFDGVTAPDLPAGWTTFSSGAESNWKTVTGTRDSAPNAVFAPDPAGVGDSELVSPPIDLPSGPSQLTFRNNYALEAGSANIGYDGAVLEIKIGAGAFTDILDAGGSFETGGYNNTISASYGNPLAGRQAWSGNSGGFISTIVDLPASASGQPIQLKWRCGSDSSTKNTGWYVDSISISGTVCCDASSADLSVAQTPSPALANAGSRFTWNIAITNFGPNAASDAVVTDTLPAQLNFISAGATRGSWTNDGENIIWTPGAMNAGETAALAVTVESPAAGTWTNSVGISGGPGDPRTGNNSTDAIIVINSPLELSATPDLNSGKLMLTWSSVPGQTYRVEYSDSLDHPVWISLGADIQATGETASASDTIDSATQRFYRIEVVPSP